MLRKLFLLVLLVWLPQSIAAAYNNAYCDQLYEQVKIKTTPDPENCIPTVEETEPFEQCEKLHDKALPP